MLFSKSFGYAIRAILFLASQSEERGAVQLDEIADSIMVPRYFLAKVMNKLVKEGILSSAKGHHGGFTINENTRKVPLKDLVAIMGERYSIDDCVLHLGKCNRSNPCPVHDRVAPLRAEWDLLLQTMQVGDLATTQSGPQHNLKCLLM